MIQDSPYYPAVLEMSFALRGLRHALWGGGGGEPTIVEVGEGLLEMQIVVEPAKMREAGAWLQRHHKDKYMVWSLVQNLDEEAFDNGVQDATSLVCQFPLLEDILKVCHAIRAWIDCDEGNCANYVPSSSLLKTRPSLSQAPSSAARTCCFPARSPRQRGRGDFSGSSVRWPHRACKISYWTRRRRRPKAASTCR